MKEQKRIKFNPKSGMALPAVLIILMIVSILGTALYAYSMQSIRSVRFASDAKKAEYLARAGVESTAFAYQQATSSLSKQDGNGNRYVNDFFNEANKIDNATKKKINEIVSNDVYLVWHENNYKYVLASEVANYESKNVIGFFRVKVDEVTKTDKVSVTNYKANAANTGNEQIGKTEYKNIQSGIKIFTAVGYAGETSRTKTAYIDDAVLCSGLYYGEAGIVDGRYTDGNGSYGSNTTTTVGAGKPFVQSGSYKTATKINFNYKWINQWFPSLGTTAFSLNVASETIPFALAYSAGNMIVNDPADGVNGIAFKTDQSNYVSFVGLNNVFVQTSVDTTPSPSRFNSIVFKGRKSSLTEALISLHMVSQEIQQTCLAIWAN